MFSREASKKMMPVEAHMYKKVIFGQEGVEYVKSRLDLGGTLSRKILEIVETQTAMAYTYLPVSGGAEEITRFSSCGIADPAVSRSALSDEIAAFLLEKENRFLILQNSSARKGDAWLPQAKSKVLYYHDEVYHLISSQDLGTISTLLSEGSNTWLNVGFFVDTPEINSFLRVELSEDEISAFSRSCRKIFVDAYDLDGVVLLEI